MLKKMNAGNALLTILPCDAPSLSRYGRLVRGIDCREMFDKALRASQRDDVTYVRDVENLHPFASFEKIRRVVYGEKLVQAGTCFGYNDRMNGMEYHEGSEVIVFVTDAVLILGRKEDIAGNRWESSLAEIFYFPPGTVLELYGGTLHLAPCRVTEDPFCTIIILPEGTNTPLNGKDPEDPLKFMVNKWLICHKDSPAASRGGYVGITGKNTRIIPV